MGMFLFAAVALVGFTVLLLLRPWQSQAADATTSEREVNTGIYRDQLAELDRDLAAGTLAAADHAQARAELQRRLLDDTAPAGVAAATPPRGMRHTALALAVTVPLLATGLYGVLGQPLAMLPQAAAQDAQHDTSEDEVNQMVAGLAAKLQKNPDDPKGWAMLARSYRAMGKLPEAQAAFARIGDELQKDPTLLAAYADVIAALDGGNLDGKPMELVTRALQLDPDHGMALSLAATAAYKRQDFALAARHWEHLLKQLPPESQDAKWVLKTLDEIRPKIAAAVTTPTAPAAPTRAAPATGATAAATGKTVSGSVTLASELAARVQPSDTVYVFARSADGSRMPLAVQRARVADLPLQFKLDDTLAISPKAKLSDAAQVRIEVRVSRNGNAAPASGDLYGVSEMIKTGTQHVALKIDQIQP
jgi:cytochrome c-type biogenesis protein CcmH